MAHIVFLKDKKLRELSDLIYGQEVENIQNIKFSSEAERVKYLSSCLSNYNSIKSLLNGGVALVTNALQIVRNYTVRKDYLAKINAHVQSLMEELEIDNPAQVSQLTNRVQHYNKAVMEYTKMYQSTASQEFSRMLKNNGIKFQTLAKLRIHGPFKNLTDEQKLQVYDAIIEASGRGKVLVEETLKAIAVPRNDDTNLHEENKLETKFEASSGNITMTTYALKTNNDAGKALLLFKAAYITWDIYTSDHTITTTTRHAVQEAAKLAGAPLVEIIQAAVETGLEGVEASVVFVTAVGLAVGLVGAFIIGEVAGLLFDLIFGSGGAELPLSTQGHVFHVAAMPNGKELALQIAH
ncbi:hypothetical protein FEM48_Zijuj11G0090000 [Ziziphus jujuba var. spinosa]|uniref:Uncharacterized protein n=1 Tax=Ziziphus jujuba var. spinosa TaxID=714518 RepID=A0A978UI11_ZIZJJ|nr:hypothetical protein FEM48_Zijuj11G0090000 [Ziziphus jujuba var. spinosa]